MSTEEPKHGINQNLLIAIIGAAATILAALIPVIINMNKSAPAPTFTPAPPPTTVVFTDTPAAAATSAQPQAAATETNAFTATPVPPSETPTTPVGIYDVYLAQDKAGTSKTSTFGPQQTVYIFFNINDPSGAKLVKVAWYAVDVKGFPANTILSSDESTVIRLPSSYEMLYSPAWKVGKYKVELYLNGSLASTQEFEVK